MNNRKYKFAVIGNPIEHSLSPLMHNIFFQQLNIDAQYQAVKLNFENLEQFFQELRSGSFDGINITLPFKEEVLKFIDKVSDDALKIGAVNCIKVNDGALIGFNTDYYGFSQSLKHNGIDISENRFLVLGAGGVARSVVYALSNSNAECIFIINRNKDRAEKLIKDVQFWNFRNSINLTTFEEIQKLDFRNLIVINCTSLGMAPEINTSPFPSVMIKQDQVFIDTIYNPLYTLFLKEGFQKGSRVINGIDMFIFQGIQSLSKWLDMDITDKIDIKTVRRTLEDKL